MPAPITGPVTSVSFRDQMGFTVAHDGGTTFFVTESDDIMRVIGRVSDVNGWVSVQFAQDDSGQLVATHVVEAR